MKKAIINDESAVINQKLDLLLTAIGNVGQILPQTTLGTMVPNYPRDFDEPCGAPTVNTIELIDNRIDAVNNRIDELSRMVAEIQKILNI